MVTLFLFMLLIALHLCVTEKQTVTQYGVSMDTSQQQHQLVLVDFRENLDL